MSVKLSWGHYISLIGISEAKSRKFYENQAILENWSVRELERQVNSSLYERLLLSKDKKAVLKLAKRGNAISSIDDVIKSPYIGFLKIPQSHKVTEKVLE